MAADADPYRVLGLARGATLDEVKRAYRRLAKINHPDAAGESALPKFLAIQGAYEQLIGGSGAAAKGRRGSAAPRRPWEADPERSDATSRAYGGRPRSAPPGAKAGPTSAGAPGPKAESPGAKAGPTRPGATGPKAAGGGRPGRRRTYERPPDAGAPAGDTSPGGKARPPNKATLGSTSYDGADGPFEPDWGGASWYGTTSGTYWTLNPKEYADPRKHGPEYQARARRSARARAGEASPGGEGSPGGEATDRPARPTHTTTSWWDSTVGHTDPPDPTGETRRDRPGAGPPRSDDPPPPDLGRAAADIARVLTDERFGGPRRRLARAIVGWLPIAFGLGWLVGEVTGCGRFAATCTGAAEPVLLGLQVAVFALLLLVPAVATIATTAALSLFVAAVAASLILSASGGAVGGGVREAALGVVLVIAWLGGLALALARRARTLRSAARPVS
jgi:hypothetical protein